MDKPLDRKPPVTRIAAIAVLVLAVAAAIAFVLWQRQRLPIADVSFQSPSLSAFWRHPVAMRARILLPGSYDSSPDKRYPVIYQIHAFGSSYLIGRKSVAVWQQAMRNAGTEFIVVFLDASMPDRTHHVFADSANNGPWGTALVTEFIPYLEKNFRMTGTAQTRFLAGHSSGGWAALWLQANFPRFFGGAWSSAPDPVDFHNFLGSDLTRSAPGNFYADAKGKDRELVRGTFFHPAQSIRAYVRTEDAHGSGGQFASFDNAFSPRATSGKPLRLFDHRSGNIDAPVAHYWENHYDIARLLRSQWPRDGSALEGKLHVFVGTEDTYHLEQPATLLGKELQALHSNAEVIMAPGLDHATLASWHGGLTSYEVAEMAHALSK